MSRLLSFFKKISFVLLFILLEIVAFRFFIDDNIYQKAKILKASNYVVGGLYGRVSAVEGYFGLKRENQKLMDEIARLNDQMGRMTLAGSVDSLGVILDSASVTQMYDYMSVKVQNNTINKRENYIIINKGSADGVQRDMALISTDGIVGYVIECSDHFSVAMSVLNVNFRTSGKIKGDDFFGSIYWDGMTYDEVVLSELPKYSQFEIGDTVVTTNYSYIFPPDQVIGTIISSELINATFYEVRVKLAADMSRLNLLLAVKYQYKEELKTLEESVKIQ